MKSKLPFTSSYLSRYSLSHSVACNWSVQIYIEINENMRTRLKIIKITLIFLIIHRAKFHASNRISFVEQKLICSELQRCKVFLILIECNRVSKIHWVELVGRKWKWLVEAREKDGDSGRVKNYSLLYTTISRKL